MKSSKNKPDTKNKIILFDFDGVIVDSFDIAFEVQKIVHPGLTKDDYRGFFNGNVNDWTDGFSLERDEAEKINQEFWRLYIPRMNQVKVVAGIKDIIVELDKIYNLIIVSSCMTSSIRELMKRYDMVSHFDEIMGNDVHTSKIEKIRMVFEKHNVEPDNCVFVTDTLGDIKEATFTEVKSIGVAWGFQDKENLLKGDPFRIAEKPEELISIISEYFRNEKSRA